MNRRIAIGLGFPLLLLGFGAWAYLRSRPSPAVDPLKPHANAETVALSEERQKAIWEAENVAFQIERQLGPLLIAALTGGQADALRELVTEDFRGEVPHEAQQQRLEHAAVVRLRNVGLESRVESAGWAERLSQPWLELATIERTRLRVLQLERVEGTDRWQARLLIRGVGEDNEGRNARLTSYHRVEFLVPKTTRIGKKHVISAWRIDDETWTKSSATLFEEVTQQVGLADLGLKDNWKLSRDRVEQNRFQIAVEDYDRDGDLDIAVIAISQAPLLLRNDGGTFHRVAFDAGLRAPTAAITREFFLTTWIDYDNDGYPDLLLGNVLYHNDQGRRFTDVTANSQLRIAPECMGAAVADYDADGKLDLYLIYQRFYGEGIDGGSTERAQWVGEDSSGRENELWRNMGDGRFVNVTRGAGVGGGKRHTQAACWLFLDDDHFPDLYVANDFGQNKVYRNQGDGTFEDISSETKAAGFATSMGVAAGDVNNDGRTDIYVANMFSKMGRRIIGQVSAADYPIEVYEQIKGSCAGNRLYEQDASGNTFRERGEQLGVDAVGWAYAPAMFDVDHDGWLDLYATTGFLSFERGKPDG